MVNISVGEAFTGEKKGVEVVTRDFERDVLPLMSCNLSGGTKTSQSEFMASCKGIQLAQELFISH